MQRLGGLVSGVLTNIVTPIQTVNESFIWVCVHELRRKDLRPFGYKGELGLHTPRFPETVTILVVLRVVLNKQLLTAALVTASNREKLDKVTLRAPISTL
jgi:hypothetical protein